MAVAVDEGAVEASLDPDGDGAIVGTMTDASGSLIR
jgi:hypothetical protein